MITLQEIESKLSQTANTIEKALEDIKANKATKTEVLSLIEEKTKADKEMLAASKVDIGTLNTGFAEANKDIGDIKKKLRELRQGNRSGGPFSSAYRGYFSSPQEAKVFALTIMAVATSGDIRLTDRFEFAKKSLDEMGVEPYWTDGAGKKTMVGSSQTGGGALVTVEQIPSIIMLIEQYGRFRANAQVVPMGAGMTSQPKIDELLAITCPGEGVTTTVVDPKLQSINLVPRTFTALTAYSMELEDDSLVALGEMLAGLFARSFAYYEDLVGFLGDSSSTYFGIQGITGALMKVSTTIANIKSLVVGTGDTWPELIMGDFVKLVGAVPQMADDGNLYWYVHRYFYYTIMVTLALAATGGSAAEIILAGGLPQKTFLSYPVQFTQVMPKVTGISQICALLANLRMGAMLGTRGGIEFAQADQVYFKERLIAVRGIDRVAFNAHGVGDTTNAGPICGLITAAA